MLLSFVVTVLEVPNVAKLEERCVAEQEGVSRVCLFWWRDREREGRGGHCLCPDSVCGAGTPRLLPSGPRSAATLALGTVSVSESVW